MVTGRIGAQPSTWRIPAEGTYNDATFMQWPVNREVCRPDGVFLEMLQDTIAGLANAIVMPEPVITLLPRHAATTAARKLSRDTEVWDSPTDDFGRVIAAACC